MSRSRRFLGGLSFAYLNQAAVMLTGLWLARFYLRHLGQHDYGLWLAGTQLLTYLMLMDFGIVALLPREVAYATGRGGAMNPEIAPILGQSARVVLLQTPVVALGALVLWLTIRPEWEQLRMPLFWVMLAFVVTFPMRIFAATLEGLQDLAYLGSVQLAAWAANVVTSVLLISNGFGLESLAVGWLAFQLITTASAFVRLRRRFPHVLPHKLPHLEGPQIFTFFRRGFWLSVAQIAQSLLSGTDLLIVTYVLGPSIAVVYAMTGKLVNVLSNQPQLLMNAASPAISELKATGNYPRLLVVSICLTRVMMIASGMVACVVLAVNGRFVTWWVGKDIYGGFPLTCLLLAAMLVRHLNHTTVASLICYGREKRISLTTLSDGLVTLASSVIGIRLFGLIGAPIGSLLGASLVSVPLNLTGLAREMSVAPAVLLQSLLPWFWRFAIVAGLAQFVRKIPNLNLFLAAPAVALVYGLVVLPLFFREPLDQYTRPFRDAFRRNQTWVMFRRAGREGYWRALRRWMLWRRILKTAPVATATEGSTEVRLMCYYLDYLCAIWALKSFYLTAGVTYPLSIQIHGRAPARVERTLRQHFPNARIVTQSEADHVVEKHLIDCGWTRLLEARRANQYMQKLTDNLILSGFPHILLLDSDVLFFRRPSELLEFQGDHIFQQDYESTYVIEKAAGVSVAPRLNAGIMKFRTASISLARCNDYLADFPNYNGWLEQTLLALHASETDTANILPPTYLISFERNIDPDTLVARHYAGPTRSLMTEEGMPWLIRHGFLKS